MSGDGSNSNQETNTKLGAKIDRQWVHAILEQREGWVNRVDEVLEALHDQELKSAQDIAGASEMTWRRVVLKDAKPLPGGIIDKFVAAATDKSDKTGKVEISLEAVGPEIDSIVRRIVPDIHKWDGSKIADYQKQELGRFYKQCGIPPALSERDIKLVMLDISRDTQATDTAGRTVVDIIKADQDKKQPTGLHTIALVGRSGVGKTATIVNVAKTSFVIYMCAGTPTSRQAPDFPDSNFSAMGRDIELAASAIKASRKPPDGTKLDKAGLLSQDTALKLMAQDRVTLEVVARLLYLYGILCQQPDINPDIFFRCQANGGIEIIRQYVRTLQAYHSSTIIDMLNKIKSMMVAVRPELSLVIAVDEAQLSDAILKESLLSPKVLASQECRVTNQHGNVIDEVKRGFLTPLCVTLCNLTIGASIIVSGTAFSLADAERVWSCISKPELLVLVTHFPTCKQDDVHPYVSSILDMSGVTTSKEQARMLSGRKRFSVSAIWKLIVSKDNPGRPKQEIWDAAVTAAIVSAKEDIGAALRSAIKKPGISELLGRMIVAGKMYKSNISFPRRHTADLVDRGLCALSKQADGYNWVMEEPLVLEVAEQVVKDEEGIDAEIIRCFSLLHSLIEILGKYTTTKGNILEPIVRRALLRFNGKLVYNLPFLRDILASLPDWSKQNSINIEAVGTPDTLGFQDDLAFLTLRPINKLASLANTTRPDGAWFFTHELAAALGIKLYGSDIPASMHLANLGSTDLRQCFLTNDEQINHTVQDVREAFAHDLKDKPIRGILRIHLEFPGTATPHTSTVVGQDIIAIITNTNINDFFLEDGKNVVEDKLMADIKELLKFIAIPSKDVQGCTCKGVCITKRCKRCFQVDKECTSKCECKLSCPRRKTEAGKRAREEDEESADEGENEEDEEEG